MVNKIGVASGIAMSRMTMSGDVEHFGNQDFKNPRPTFNGEFTITNQFSNSFALRHSIGFFQKGGDTDDVQSTDAQGELTEGKPDRFLANFFNYSPTLVFISYSEGVSPFFAFGPRIAYYTSGVYETYDSFNDVYNRSVINNYSSNNFAFGVDLSAGMIWEFEKGDLAVEGQFRPGIIPFASVVGFSFDEFGETSRKEAQLKSHSFGINLRWSWAPLKK